jgi:long-subunit fatty acid transport protein
MRKSATLVFALIALSLASACDQAMYSSKTMTDDKAMAGDAAMADEDHSM